MQVQISPNATMTVHSYQGPTRNPLQSHLDSEMSKYQGMSADECRQALREAGALDPDAARARVWAQFSQREKVMFCSVAGVRTIQAEREWADLAGPEKARLWSTLERAASWGDRIREAME